MNYCEPSFLEQYFFMCLIIGFWPSNWKDMGILIHYHNITLVCLWGWYKIEKYGINSANFFKQIRTKSIEIHFYQKIRTSKKVLTSQKTREHLRLNRFLLVLIKKSVLILDST